MRRLRMFIDAPFYEKVNLVTMVYFRAKTHFFYRRFFGSMGSKCIIRTPLSLNNTRYIHLGDRVQINRGVRLEALIDKASRVPELRIGNNVNIEQNVQIICHNRITIGSKVAIAGGCAIVDVTHPHDDVLSTTPMASRIADDDAVVEIGDGAFLGYGVVVLPNVRIGRSSVVGANSVVTKDIPDFCVAAGAPAALIRRFDWERSEWVKVPHPVTHAS